MSLVELGAVTIRIETPCQFLGNRLNISICDQIRANVDKNRGLKRIAKFGKNVFCWAQLIEFNKFIIPINFIK